MGAVKGELQHRLYFHSRGHFSQWMLAACNTDMPGSRTFLKRGRKIWYFRWHSSSFRRAAWSRNLQAEKDGLYVINRSALRARSW